MSKSNLILSIHKSRQTMFEILEKQEYDVSEYSDFSINEIDAMYTNSQLDVLLTNTTNDKKVYIKYYIDPNIKQIKPIGLDEIIEDLYNIDTVLTKKDTLIIIMFDKPNETILSKITYLYDHEGIFVVIFNIKQLQFNILNHSLNPQNVKVLEDEAEINAFKQKYHVNSNKQLKEIGRFDPFAMALLLRPGQIIKIIRSSPTASEYEDYRVCV
jgi:DNA-directed RNA polymerase subunit H (RpoH/RPB5)